jgi:hypothetical protein
MKSKFKTNSNVILYDNWRYGNMRSRVLLFSVFILLSIVTLVNAQTIRRRPNAEEILAAKLEEAWQIREIIEQLHFPRDSKPSSKEFYKMMITQHDYEYKAKTSDAKPVSVFLADQKIQIPAGTDQVVEYVYIMSYGKVPLDSLNVLFNDFTIKNTFKDYLNRRAFPEFAFEWCNITMNKGAYSIPFFSLLASAYMIYKQGDMWAVDLTKKTNKGFVEVFKMYEREKTFTQPKYGREVERHRKVTFDFVVHYFTDSPYWKEALDFAKENYNTIGYLDQIFVWSNISSPMADFRELKVRDLAELGAKPIPADTDERKSDGSVTSRNFPNLFIDYIDILTQGKINLGKLIDVSSPTQTRLDFYNSLLAKRDFPNIGYNWFKDNLNMTTLPKVPLLESIGVGKSLLESGTDWIANLTESDDFYKVYLRYADQRYKDDESGTTLPESRPRKALEFAAQTLSGTAMWNNAIQYSIYRYDKSPYPSEFFQLTKAYNLYEYLQNKDNITGKTDEQINDLKAASILEIVYQTEKYLKTIELDIHTSPTDIERTLRDMHDAGFNPLLQQISGNKVEPTE